MVRSRSAVQICAWASESLHFILFTVHSILCHSQILFDFGAQHASGITTTCIKTCAKSRKNSNSKSIASGAKSTQRIKRQRNKPPHLCIGVGVKAKNQVFWLYEYLLYFVALFNVPSIVRADAV